MRETAEIWSPMVCAMLIIFLSNIYDFGINDIIKDSGKEEVSEKIAYRCDTLENGTILESFAGGEYTTYQFLICDDTSNIESREKWVTTSPQTYAIYEQGKITKLENWEE